MTDPGTEAIAAFQRWNDAFNARDMETQIAHMHFPHVRLAENQFRTWDSGDDFRAGEDNLTDRLNAEGWHRTESLSVDVVQAGGDKVHLAIRQSRRSADGVEYKPFDTLWIFTRIDDRWGVQLRSSFLAS
ncbi:MAG: hypothetical protein VB860_08860 [Dehalococcoidia bacterium]